MPPGNQQPPLSPDAQAQLRQALALHQRGQLDQARELYKAVLKIYPKNADALHLLGVAFAQGGDHQRAADFIGQAIAVNSNNAAFHYNRGAALQKLGQYQAAIASYDKTLALKPDFAEGYNNRGNALQELKRFVEAVASYDKAIALRRDNAEAYNNRGNALLALERFDDALASFDAAVALKGDYDQAHANRGLALLELKRFEDAVASYDRAIALKSEQVEAHCNRGIALQRLHRFDEAVASFDRALTLDPYNAEAHANRGTALASAGRFSEALASYDNALALDENDVVALYNRGNALAALQRLSEAVASYDMALALARDNVPAHHNRGLALQELGQFEPAIASFDEALARDPDNAAAHADRGRALQDLNRFEEALESYDKALAIDSNRAETYNNRGVALQALNRYDEALASYDWAIALNPDNAEAFTNRGNALQELKRFDEALDCYNSALALEPDNAGLHKNRGIVLADLRRLGEAIASFETALALTPENSSANSALGNASVRAAQPDFLFGAYLHAKMQICDWDQLNENLEKFSADIANGKKVTPPFAAMTLLDEPELVLKAARIWVKAKYPHRNVGRRFLKRASGEKLRIGYYSADFQEHATTHLIAEMLENHDHEKFEIYGFSFGPDAHDSMRPRVAAAFDRFIDVKSQSDREVADMSGEIGIDIAVDLKGFTGDGRLGLFAERCAPIQASYLGYPGASGAEFIDYIIADKILIPKAQQVNFTEKAVYLPGSYQANDSTRKIAERAYTRQELGLPETGFVFCSFNNPFKIFPETFDAWMRMLKAVDASVLWLLEDNADAAENLRKQAEARGVDSARLVFAQRLAPSEHLARQRCADLFLDTLPCCAHTTASDALWAGLPLLTLTGKTFAGRVAASLLHALELPDLVTSTPDEYEAKAIALASKPEQLRALKAKLAEKRLTSPLFRGDIIARRIEAAYEAMYARYRADLTPDIIEVHT